MAKNCKFCGAEMDDNAVKCPECEKLVPGAEILIDKQRQQKKKKKTIIITVIVCIVLILGIIVLSVILKKNKTGANSYIDVIDMNISAMFDDNPQKYLKSYPEFMRDTIEDTLGSLAENGFDEYMYLLSDEIVKMYGSDAGVSYNVTNKQRLEDDASQEYLEALFEYITDYKIEDFKVEEAYQLNLEITINGSVGTQTFNTNVAVMKFNGSWYILNIINPVSKQVDNQQG